MPVVKPQGKIISTRVETSRPEKINRIISVKEFYERRNKILVLRSVGGLGDILMHRMMFEDFKKIIPDCEIHFCCPRHFHDAVKDHPFIDKVISVEDFDKKDYIISYNTTTACGRYEMRKAPESDLHRSDIWASHCGIELTSHDMHINLTNEEKMEGKRIIEKYRDREGPSVCIAPVSAMENKNLLPHQLLGLVKGLHERGYYAFGLHKIPIMPMLKNNIPVITEINIRQWMSVIDQSDYVISVDTAAFHCAGGLKKPLVGIFTFADGEVYGKYFDFFLVQKHRKHDPCWTCGPCYNWTICPKSKTNPKPCLTEITVDMLLEKADMMFEKWQLNKTI